MERIVIQVKEKRKAKILVEFLTALDFVSSVQSSTIEDLDSNTATAEEQADFFSFAGLWADRDISLESIRQKAWPRQQS